VEIPAEFQSDPRFSDGARLQLVPVSVERPLAGTPVAGTEEERRAAWQAFIDIRGIFADSPGDGNASLEQERLRELADEAR
jgi:hypothetical protein